METAAENKVTTTRLHTSCKTLTIAGFKECYCNKNFEVLIIEGEATADQLAAAWNDIIFEYGTMIKTENSSYLFDLQKRIAELTHHISYVDHALELLLRKFSHDVINELIELGYDGVYQFDDHVQYVKQLGRVRSLCKTRVVDLQELQDEYARYNVSTESAESQTEEQFEDWMATLSRFQHYHINQDSTVVTQWAGIINAYIRHKKNPQPTDG